MPTVRDPPARGERCPAGPPPAISLPLLRGGAHSAVTILAPVSAARFFVEPLTSRRRGYAAAGHAPGRHDIAPQLIHPRMATQSHEIIILAKRFGAIGGLRIAGRYRDYKQIINKKRAREWEAVGGSLGERPSDPAGRVNAGRGAPPAGRARPGASARAPGGLIRGMGRGAPGPCGPGYPAAIRGGYHGGYLRRMARPAPWRP
jgi:hypothetical protein